MGSSFRARFTWGLALLALMFTGVSFLAIGALQRLGGSIGTILQENYVSVIACEQMNEALERLDSAALFSASGQETIARPMLGNNREAFQSAFAREAGNVTLPGEGELVQQVDTHYRDYIAATDRVLSTADGGPRDGYFHELLPKFYRLKGEIHAILRMNQATMEEADRHARSMARATVRRAFAISVVALLFVAWLVWWLPMAIVRPLRELQGAAQHIGEGNLEDTVTVSGVRELVPLAEAFNTMRTKLRAYRESSLGELLAAKDLARSTVECLLDPVMVLTPEGDILLTNTAASQVFGVREGAKEELQTAEITLPKPIHESVTRVISSGEPVLPTSLSQAMRWTAHDAERYYLIRAAPLQSESNEKTKVIVVAQDVTRIRRIDELKSHVVATVSHEFKTPLTSLRMATHLLLEPRTGPLTEGQSELVTMARDDTERLGQLVDEFLDLTRIEAEAGALHQVASDPVRLLTEAADAHRTMAHEKGVQLEIANDHSLEVSPLDPEKMAVALGNLVSNAIRHTPAGGNVTLAARRDGSALYLEVRDTGEGIEAPDLPHVFERYRRGASGSSDHHRMGLGLTIVQEIVQQHGGDVKVMSTRGKGTTFTLVIPLQKNV